MQKDISLTDQGDYLLTEFSGEFSIEAGKQVIDAMTKASLVNHRPRVLLDCRKMTGNMPIMARFQVALYAATAREVITKIALVNRPEVILPDGFVENVAVNRGLNVKIFTDMDQAVRWLKDRPAEE